MPPATCISPLFAYEGLTAFFLEATFLGVLLFGRKLVPPLGAFCRGLLVAVGTLFVVVLDSRRQQLDADAGRLRDDRRPLLPEGLDRDHLQSVVPLSPRAHGLRVLRHHRFVVLGVGAYTVRRGRFVAEGRMMLSTDAVVADDLRAAADGASAISTASTRCNHQPAKLAAIEGAVGQRPRRARLDHRLARDEARNATVCEIAHPASSAASILTHSLGRRGATGSRISRRRAAAGRDRLFRLPHHGRRSAC